MRNMRQSYLNQIKDMFNRSNEEVKNEFSENFTKYFERLIHHPKMVSAYSDVCKHIFTVTNAKNKNVLDIGCGYGLISIHLAIYGCKVTSIDINEERIRIFKKILSGLEPTLSNVNVEYGDAIEFDCKNDFYDVVICNEVVSHVRDLDLLFSHVNKALKKGGRMYISDGNNGLNIFMKRERQKIWKKAEKSFRIKRKKLIQKQFQSLDDEILNFLVKETAGMYGSEISLAVNQYLTKGRIMEKPIFKFKDPETGYYPERDFNPFELKQQITKYGFNVKILRPYFVAKHPSFIKSFIKKICAQTVMLFHPITLPFSTKFEILAEKMN